MKVTSVLYLVIFIWKPQDIHSSTVPAEIQALNDIYNSMGGTNWVGATNWPNGDPCLQSWRGVTCTGSTTTSIAQLNLYTFGLQGAFPASISSLTSLFNLYVKGARISGDFAVLVSNLPTGMTNLGLYDNQLSGTFPSSFCKFTRLSSLSVGTNQITGPLPSCLSTLTRLKQFYVSSNQLTGIPPDLSSSPSLSSVGLAGNLWNGTVPSWLGRLPLTFIDLENSSFTDTTFPNFFANWNSLTYLGFGSVNLIGPIPESLITSLTLLQTLLIRNSPFLTGPVPSNLGSLTRLTTL